MLGEADTLDLAGGLGEQAMLFGAIEAQRRRDEALAATQVGTDGDVLEHRHLPEQADVLKGPAHAAAGDFTRGEGFGRLAKEGDLSRRKPG